MHHQSTPFTFPKLVGAGLLTLSLLGGCGGCDDDEPGEESNNSMTDAGMDSGMSDAGMDSGMTDTGMDSGMTDAGMDSGMDMDGGMPDDRTVLLTSTSGGDDLLGAVYEINVGDLSEQTILAEVSGSHAHGYARNDGGAVFNPTDGKFYGILINGGWQQNGVVFSFDPTTDELDHLAQLPAMRPNDGDLVRYFPRPPVVSADGKSLLALAMQGGRETRPCVFDNGDGALIHIDIDPASANFGDAKVVFELNTYNQTTGGPNGVFGRITQLVWGPASGGGEAIYFTAEGEFWDANRCPNDGAGTAQGVWIALEPTNANDLSQPWQVDTSGNGTDPSTTDIGYNALWDPTPAHPRFVWATFNRRGDNNTLVRASDGNQLNPQIVGSQDRCENYPFLMDGNPDFDLICSGTPGGSVNINSPRLFTIRKDLQTFADQRSFDAWWADDLQLLGATSSGSNIYANVGDFNGDDFSANPSLLVNIESNGAYPTTTLATGGTGMLGKWFVGKPAVGGLATEPIEDRYVIFFSYDGGTDGLGALIEYDRQTSTTTVISLGQDDAAYLGGRPRVSGLNAWVPARYAGYEFGQQAGAYPGFAVLDGTAKTLTGTRYDTMGANSRQGVPWWNLEYVDMADTDEVWAIAPEISDFNRTSIVSLNPSTGAIVTDRSYTISHAEAWPSLVPAFRPTAAGDDLWFLTPGPAAGQVAVLNCVDNDRFSNGADQQWNLDFDPVAGPVFEPTSGAIYIPADDGTIRRFVPDSGVECGSFPADLGITSAATGISELPSTPLEVGSDGLIYFADAAGSLVSFDPSDNSVATVAAMAATAPTTRKAVGYITEVDDGTWMGVLADSDANGEPTARHLFRVETAEPTPTLQDISDLVSPDDPWPGVVRYR